MPPRGKHLWLTGGWRSPVVPTSTYLGPTGIPNTPPGQVVPPTPPDEPDPPIAPVTITATAVSTSEIDVSWSSVSNADTYTLQVSTTGISNWTALSTGSGTSYSHTGLAAATTRYYRVIATNADGNSPATSTVYATTDSGLSVPGMITTLTATVIDDDSIYLSWYPAEAPPAPVLTITDITSDSITLEWT